MEEVIQPALEGQYFQKPYKQSCNKENTNSDERDDDTVGNAKAIQPTWRLKERMKTTGVCMILALNIGTDPPDVSKPTPCATKLCWLDPSGVSRAKAREIIGERLEEQYAKWQQRVKLKYKRALDPTVEDIRNLCITMRRHAKSERLLLHYNGHGVPRPTVNGELWVFDKNNTQYIPLPVGDLRSWIGRPTIVILDCSNAGVLIPAFTSTISPNRVNTINPQSQMPFHSMNSQRESHPQIYTPNYIHASQPQYRHLRENSVGFDVPEFTDSFQFGGKNDDSSSSNDCIVLCPCLEGELLPMNPAYPADIFTSCLTTPIPIALRWFVRQNPLSMGGLDPESVDRIPGKLTDRKTPLGELSW